MISFSRKSLEIHCLENSSISLNMFFFPNRLAAVLMWCVSTLFKILVKFVG